MGVCIAICDDEKAEVDYLAGLARSWAEGSGVNAKISAYDSAKAFLFAYDADKSLDTTRAGICFKQIFMLLCKR